jgi:predicted nuclease with RNAse H fold
MNQLPQPSISEGIGRTTATPIVVGIDVGAPAKGYHVVALRGAAVVAKLHSRNALEVARWCVAHEARVVAVDAPCRWRVAGALARLAERELAGARIACFSTPTEDKAHGHAFYTWMFAGQELYKALARQYPIHGSAEQRSSVAIETFPQAVACALAGKVVSAKKKFSLRSELIRKAEIDLTALKSIDEVDATLCAIAASAFVNGRFKQYGDRAGGFIIVPAGPLSFEQPKTSTNCGVPGSALTGVFAAAAPACAADFRISGDCC